MGSYSEREMKMTNAGQAEPEERKPRARRVSITTNEKGQMATGRARKIKPKKDGLRGK